MNTENNLFVYILLAALALITGVIFGKHIKNGSGRVLAWTGEKMRERKEAKDVVEQEHSKNS